MRNKGVIEVYIVGNKYFVLEHAVNFIGQVTKYRCSFDHLIIDAG